MESQAAVTDRDKDELQLVVFRIAGEAYGVEIASVREIVASQPITRVPGAPPFMDGVLNLRGSVIPVMDLRHRFNMARREGTRETRIIVAEIGAEEKSSTVGLVVDAVSEVLRIPSNAVEAPRDLMVGQETEFLRGIAKTDAGLVVLLDLQRLLEAREQEDLKRMDGARPLDASSHRPCAPGDQADVSEPGIPSRT